MKGDFETIQRLINERKTQIINDKLKQYGMWFDFGADIANDKVINDLYSYLQGNASRIEKKIKRIYSHNGGVYSLSELAKKYNILASSIKYRLSKGMSLSMALKPTRKAKKYIYYGKQTTLKDLSEKYNVNLKTIYSRLKRNWSLEKSLMHAEN